MPFYTDNGETLNITVYQATIDEDFNAFLLNERLKNMEFDDISVVRGFWEGGGA